MKKSVVFCALTAALAFPSMCVAQGCSQCRDATAGSAPQAQKALRRAIPLLGLPAICILAGGLILAGKIQPGSLRDESSPTSPTD